MSVVESPRVPGTHPGWPPGFEERIEAAAKRTTGAESMTDDEIHTRLEALDVERASLMRHLASNRTERLEAARSRGFTVADLRFASGSRCKCGALLAYPRDTDAHGSWSCARTLVSASERADGDAHDEPKPFAFWSVKAWRDTTPPTDAVIFGAPE